MPTDSYYDPPDYDLWLLDVRDSGNLLDFAIEDPDIILPHFTRFNREIAQFIQEYGIEEAYSAIWFLYSIGSNYTFYLLHRAWEGQYAEEFFDSMKTLFAEGFNRYCINEYSNKNSHLNKACYDLWDMTGIECHTTKDNPETLKYALDFLEFALYLDNLACRQSALHGLGFCYDEAPAEVTKILAEPLRKNILGAHFNKCAKSILED